jgi:hypothetical protein
MGIAAKSSSYCTRTIDSKMPQRWARSVMPIPAQAASLNARASSNLLAVRASI